MNSETHHPIHYADQHLRQIVNQYLHPKTWEKIIQYQKKHGIGFMEPTLVSIMTELEALEAEVERLNELIKSNLQLKLF